ncbi:MAG TPA: hypothetical protein VKR21_14655 [Solirubrobacteraceae bacterium]|nr:hypothetical protein [Solirubrobacteraceae bacterium]
MSMVVRFSPQGLTTAQYAAVMSRLNEAGHWPPDGLEYHVCFGAPDELRVSEIWTSSEQLEAFGQHLMPILNEVGVSLAGPPERLEIHNQERF